MAITNFFQKEYQVTPQLLPLAIRASELGIPMPGSYKLIHDSVDADIDANIAVFGGDVVWCEWWYDDMRIEGYWYPYQHRFSASFISYPEASPGRILTWERAMNLLSS